jgi:hypothetical protein
MDYDFENFASELQNVSEDGISRIASLARQQLSLEDRINDLEAELKAVKQQHAAISEEHLPAAMAEHGVSQLRMGDGSEVTVAKFYGASIPKDKTDEAFGWLDTNGFGDLVKNQIAVSFGRNEGNRADNIYAMLEEDGYAPSRKKWVEPMTLKAFVKEQVEAGTEIPSDLFGLFIGDKAKIKKGK